MAVLSAFGAMMDQKLLVLSAIKRSAYASVCPLHGASIGMHMRHSLDHCERAAAAVAILQDGRQPLLRYDVRERGVGVESDPDVAAVRRCSTLSTSRRPKCEPRATPCSALMPPFSRCAQGGHCDAHAAPRPRGIRLVGRRRVPPPDPQHARPRDRIRRTSRVSRTFRTLTTSCSYHHAAMMRLIALGHLCMCNDDLPANLGRAPATILFDRQAPSRQGA